MRKDIIFYSVREFSFFWVSNRHKKRFFGLVIDIKMYF